MRRVEAFDRTNEANVSLFNEVGQREPAVDVVLGDRNDQAQIGADHAVFRRKAVVIEHSPTQRALLLCVEEGNLVDLAEINMKIRVKGRTTHLNLATCVMLQVKHSGLLLADPTVVQAGRTKTESTKTDCALGT